MGLVAAIAISWSSVPRSHEFGGLTCRQCMEHVPAYLAGEIREPSLLESLETHLRLCPKCKPHFEEIRTEEQAATHERGDSRLLVRLASTVR